ncbi:HFX_2341 family transcriptional regulator domain-containing protein [Halogeometricum limi]|uniref:Uncharacterized protein n=1 Tax=Halogeometricum limi TaxID=555875 RepID=A0A1I6IFY0_9EURY|nr:DUF6293 family protein [Halogeometricum limi]SFR65583.1 hypothetical protein SAMN04488124_3209 [Halogeometricum limi]
MDNLAPSLDRERVHVVPLGYEFDRIVEPLRRKADLVYLLVDDSTRRPAETGRVDFDAACDSHETDAASWHETTAYQREVRDVIHGFAEVRGVPVRLTDFYDVMGVVTTIAEHHGVGGADGDSLFVNVATGPHVAAVAAAVGCMAVGARPYSVEPENRAHDVKSSPASTGVAETTDIPLHPIDGPTRDQIAVLDYLREIAEQNYTVNKRNIIREFGGDGAAGDAELDCLLGTEEKAWSARYNRLDADVLNDLESTGYVRIEKRGRSDKVSITDSGRNILAAFGHLLGE